MGSEGSEWVDRLFVIGLILVLIGITLLCIVGLIFVESPDYYNTHSDTVRNAILAGIIMIVTGAGVVMALDRLGHQRYTDSKNSARAKKRERLDFIQTQIHAQNFT